MVNIAKYTPPAGSKFHTVNRKSLFTPIYQFFDLDLDLDLNLDLRLLLLLFSPPNHPHSPLHLPVSPQR